MDRTPSARTAAAIAALILGLSVAGCGDDGARPPASPSAANSTPTRDPAASDGRVFTADPTIVGAHPIPFTMWTPVGADRIAVGFQTGSPECYGVDASVRETDKTVVVELRAGTRADAVGRMCTMIAVFGTLEVPLKSPVGDRMVLSAV
ncbi:hypothetical protein [Nocardia arizonensis]|uniref:hypothetical protein n=1 Tax=Nocardia arizonensis TaxID=1141647 RepID=UPI0006CF3C45|nr:hypothetical protein [Nocardia arizonensis]